MDSHSSCFGQFAVSARVGFGDGVDFAASGSSASVSGRWGCCIWFVITSVALRAAASGQAQDCGVVASLAQAVTVLRHHH
ncbi:hypothetical protein, partial [Pseudoxanthomonas spadix]|uniref:hypothetical protein n=1 Tax=Pseudoxanthomonas spadix TaxID=415229 RepID=UPI001B328872